MLERDVVWVLDQTSFSEIEGGEQFSSPLLASHCLKPNLGRFHVETVSMPRICPPHTNGRTGLAGSLAASIEPELIAHSHDCAATRWT